MPFAREADGRIYQRFFGAHTFRRTAIASDYGLVRANTTTCLCRHQPQQIGQIFAGGRRKV
jgi:succinate dehydrogenase/fumarate reductase flavoprotein subunit